MKTVNRASPRRGEISVTPCKRSAARGDETKQAACEAQAEYGIANAHSHDMQKEQFNNSKI